MVMWFVLTIGGSIVARLVISRIARTIITQGLLARRIVVVGSGVAAERLIDYLNKVPRTRIQLVGRFADRGAICEWTGDVRAQGTIDDLCRPDCIRNIDAIVLAMPDVSEERLSEILGKLSPLPVDIRLCRDSLEHCLPQSSYEFCEGIPLLRLYDKPVSAAGLLAKTIEDKLLAGLFLLLTGGPMLLIAALIKIDSPGPALFRQKRYGVNNQLIEVLKFRTMRHEARDENAEQLATRNDPRVTRIGAFLRRTSLDELPQLLNVIYGHMSLVGPRPHAVAAKAGGVLYKDAVREYAARHRVKPGITGWAQVNGWRGETDTVEKIQQRVKHDLFYIDNWSILFDLKILLMTVHNVVQDRENAY
jgi:Undecaprenyl-phosphate glucose phosphotransferase